MSQRSAFETLTSHGAALRNAGTVIAHLNALNVLSGLPATRAARIGEAPMLYALALGLGAASRSVPEAVGRPLQRSGRSSRARPRQRPGTAGRRS